MARVAVALALCAALATLPVPVGAQGTTPLTSPVPPPRPAAVTALATAGAQVAAPAQPAPGLIRPRPRPAGLLPPSPQTVAAPQALPAPVVPLETLISGLRPRPRPTGLIPDLQTAAAVPAPATGAGKQKQPKREKASRKGSVCGVPGIRGEKLAPITSKVKGCGVEAPVRVTSIEGIRLSQPATINCDTAIALRDWIQRGMRPAFGRREVVELQIAASYICRPRNNIKGGKISEHGRGKAIDVAGFVFSDGTSWTVLHDYNAEMRKAHKAACGIFGTTLGPGSDGYHENHLHFDTARYRSGSYCR
jgi:hypothetical protein